jgi:hypothetical protein
METVCISETLVPTYEFTQCHNPAYNIVKAISVCFKLYTYYLYNIFSCLSTSVQQEISHGLEPVSTHGFQKPSKFIQIPEMANHPFKMIVF